jgi:hypothetical protein
VQGLLGTHRAKANHIDLVVPLADAMIDIYLDFGGDKRGLVVGWVCEPKHYHLA